MPQEYPPDSARSSPKSAGTPKTDQNDRAAATPVDGALRLDCACGTFSPPCPRCYPAAPPDQKNFRPPPPEIVRGLHAEAYDNESEDDEAATECRRCGDDLEDSPCSEGDPDDLCLLCHLRQAEARLALLAKAIGEHVMPGFDFATDDATIAKLAETVREEAARICAWQPIVLAASLAAPDLAPTDPVRVAVEALPPAFEIVVRS